MTTSVTLPGHTAGVVPSRRRPRDPRPGSLRRPATRAPLRRARARVAARSGPRRVLRLRVPDEVVALVEADALREAEDALHAFVTARLPATACDLQLALDAERLEIVMSFALHPAARGA